jgi:hypothetical protein
MSRFYWIKKALKYVKIIAVIYDLYKYQVEKMYCDQTGVVICHILRMKSVCNGIINIELVQPNCKPLKYGFNYAKNRDTPQY